MNLYLKNEQTEVIIKALNEKEWDCYIEAAKHKITGNEALADYYNNEKSKCTEARKYIEKSYRGN